MLARRSSAAAAAGFVLRAVEARPPATIGLLDVQADAARRMGRAIPVEDRGRALVDAARRLDAVSGASVELEAGAPVAQTVGAVPVAVRALVAAEVREVAVPQDKRGRPDNRLDISFFRTIIAFMNRDGRTMSVTITLSEDSGDVLERIARATARTMPSLIEDWIEERLALVAHEATSPEPHQYLPIDDVRERFRNRYRPSDVVILMVGEAPPAGETFFYQADSHLFNATREAFSRAWGRMPTGTGFLEFLEEKGFWLYDISPLPLNRKRGRPRKEAVAAGVVKLAELIAETDPDFVVAVKTSLEGPVRQAAALAGYPPTRVRVLPFPLYQWREAYVTELAEFLGPPDQPPTPFAPPVSPPPMSLEEAMVAVLRASGGGPMPARKVSNEISGKELYTAPEGKRPDYQQVLYAARKAPALFRVTRQGVSLKSGAAGAPEPTSTPEA